MLDLNIIDASAELRLLRYLDDYTPPFEVIGTYRLIDDGMRPEATVTLKAGNQEMHEADLGVGPVDALANVLKKSLGQLFPEIPGVRLLDFRVRLIEGHIGTSSQIEVSVIFSDGRKLWKVSSVDDNVNLASFRALLEAYEYAIYLWGKDKSKIQDPESKTRAKKGSEAPSKSRQKKVTEGKKTKAAGKGAKSKPAPGAKGGPSTRARAKTASRTGSKPKK